ncbi:hypothetical protein [Tropicimonas sp.]|uniref:hypothetical protein n=1 Tax=Tropicimonas sp. TaxID=2067044 RepID=UPI003A88C0A7
MPEHDWTTRTPEPGETLTAGAVTLFCRPPAGATLISGDLGAAIGTLAPAAPLLGLMERLPDGPFALRIARDRALLCAAAPPDTEGWQGSFATSAADDLYLQIGLHGPGHADIIAAGTGAPPGAPSAACLFAGTCALLAGDGQGARIWVERPDAAALWSHLARLARAL